MRAAWWWIDRWRKSTAYTDMTAEAQGVYRNLLDELWLRDGALPIDERILAKIGGESDAWPRVRDVVMAKFHRVNGLLRNQTHDEIMAESKKRAARQKRYRDRSQNVDRNVTADVDMNVTENVAPSPDPSPSKAKSKDQRTTDMRPSAGDAPSAVAERPWNQRACESLIGRYGGTAPGGRITKALKPLVKKHGEDQVLQSWRRYLDETEAEYVSPEKFAATFGHWSGERLGKNTRALVESSKKFLASMGVKSDAGPEDV